MIGHTFHDSQVPRSILIAWSSRHVSSNTTSLLIRTRSTKETFQYPADFHHSKTFFSESLAPLTTLLAILLKIVVSRLRPGLRTGFSFPFGEVDTALGGAAPRSPYHSPSPYPCSDSPVSSPPGNDWLGIFLSWGWRFKPERQRAIASATSQLASRRILSLPILSALVALALLFLLSHHSPDIY